MIAMTRERERERVIFTSSLSYRITEFVVEEMGLGERIDEGDTRAAIERSSERERYRESEEDEEESTTT